MTEEDDEEEREDVLALTMTEEAVLASPRGDGGEAGDGGTGDRSGGRTAGEIALERPGIIAGEIEDSGTGDRSGGRTAGEIVPERHRLIAGETGDGKAGDRSGGQTAEETVLERPGLIAGETGVSGTGGRSGGWTAGETSAERKTAAGELWKDGPVWTVRSVGPEIDRAQRTAAAERTVQVEKAPRPSRDGELTWAGLDWVARGGTVGPVLDGAGRSGPAQTGPAQAGLEGLYRQTVRGLRPAAPALPPEQAGRTARAQEPGSAASLAVDELDRAVRRDSRRYDGGMSIY